jgi:hypothetical protein
MTQIGLRLFCCLEKSCAKNCGPGTSVEREGEEEKDSYLCNSGPPMILTKSNVNIVTKQTPLMRWKTQRGEVAYLSVSVMDDVVKDALSQMKPPLTNHHV